MEQCRQGKSAKWIRNRKRIGSRAGHGVPVPNPPVVGGLLELLPRARAVVASAGDRIGNAPLGAFPAPNNRLRTVGGGIAPPFGSKARLGEPIRAEDIVRIHQVLDCSPTNRERELGLDRRGDRVALLPRSTEIQPHVARIRPPPRARMVGS
ncbi:hypothetical protein H6P81_015955 [Aristolochia fimbriata]|uniref:Uncharacterized protein n=1 Tax=Aristolochia fimbriata TaxID=158543 RepID=A0AAV7E6Z6_ARIFI|nr:hypothetical protein H6P81_015955 [Aristolochia fimbriata]